MSLSVSGAHGRPMPTAARARMRNHGGGVFEPTKTFRMIGSRSTSDPRRTAPLRGLTQATLDGADLCDDPDEGRY